MKIEIIQDDITDLKVDAIVNAANTSLLGGGGVDGRIHEMAGPALREECRKIGGCPTGEARITPAFGLPSKYVIHAVGPIWKGGRQNETELLRGAYRSSLLLACEHRIRTLAFPNIGTGIYRFPKEMAALIAIQTIQGFEVKSKLQTVYFVCFEDENFHIYREILKTSTKKSQFF